MMIVLVHLPQLLLINWQSWWLSLAVSLIAIATSFVFFKIKKSKLLHENNALRQQITECSELLRYARENEQKAKESIETANRVKTDLLSKLSHEIRTPMNGVIGMASLLSETEVNSEQKEYIATIIQSSERLMTTLNNILVTDVINYSKNEIDKTVYEEQDYDLRYNIETVIESFATKAAQVGVELVYIIEKDTPEMLVGDEMRLRQILMNLIENAMRFTFRGEIVITVGILRLLEGNQVDLAFQITDTGIGLPDADVELLSKDIVDINTKKESDALPLIICKKLVTLMGGRLEVETRKGGDQGTAIKFKVRTRISLQPQRSSLQMISDVSDKKVLLVINNIASSSAIKKQLEQWHIVPTVASSAKEAMSIIATNQRFDLVLTDADLPCMGSIDLAKEVKELHPATSFILLATFENDSYKNYPGLFKSVITKPVKQLVLFENISRELTKTNIITAEPKTTSPGELSKHYPLRILVAEDNKTNQDVALKFLKKLGYQADLAQNGQEALELIGDGNYDLIFMDVQMPVKDGLETTRLIRLCLSTQPVIIAMTANAITGDKQKCIQAGMDDYISKPFRIDELTRMIEKWAVQTKIR